MPVDLSSLDLLKESFHMAGSYNWNNVDLTQFPGSFDFLAFSFYSFNINQHIRTVFKMQNH